MLKKSYQVFYILKYGKREELHHIFVMAHNQKEAVAECRSFIKETTGKTAFRATTKEPFEVMTIHGTKVLTI